MDTIIKVSNKYLEKQFKLLNDAIKKEMIVIIIATEFIGLSDIEVKFKRAKKQHQQQPMIPILV